MIKFKDNFHEGTEDSFKVIVGYKKIIRILQEFDSGIIRETLLTEKDIQQIQKELENHEKTK